MEVKSSNSSPWNRSKRYTGMSKRHFLVVKPPCQNRKLFKKLKQFLSRLEKLWFDEFIVSRWDEQFQTITSEQKIQLQPKPSDKEKSVYSVGFDLSELKNNSSMVFSIILSNNHKDAIGRIDSTVLVRNGVTATAAKKRKGQNIKWFYHGKPLNQENLQLIVTIGHDQFCMSYMNEQGKYVVHGDCPVSFLTEAEIGSVRNETFYLSVVMKNKGGSQIKVRTFYPKYGYLHPVYASSEIEPELKEQIELKEQMEQKEQGLPKKLKLSLKSQAFGAKVDSTTKSQTDSTKSSVKGEEVTEKCKDEL